MKRLLVLQLVLAGFFMTATVGWASSSAPVVVTIDRPQLPLIMGQAPEFAGKVSNRGSTPLRNLVVYASLVSLEPGQEHPVDLEDWSAQKAVHIDWLEPGASTRLHWSLRLIQAGRYGLALTVIDPATRSPVISSLAEFDVLSKPTVIAARIWPVAVGEPLLLLAFFAALRWRGKPRRARS